MRIVTGAEMAEIDRRTIEEIGIPAEALMENAGYQVALAAWELLGHGVPGSYPGGAPAGMGPWTGGREGGWSGTEKGAGWEPVRPKRPGPRVVVVAGRGNNGGDGCVAARYLVNWGARVRVYVPSAAGRRAPGDKADTGGGDGGGRDARPAEQGALAPRQVEILKRIGIDVSPVTSADLSKVKLHLAMADLVIDALMGTGFHGEPQGLNAALIDVINEAGAPVLAVDIPSGVDSATGHAFRAVRAQATVTFGLPKLGTLLFPGADYCGRLRVVDIGFPRRLLEEGANLRWLTEEEARACLPPRPANSHKGTYGHVVVVAGSRGMTGAGQLATRGAHRAGAGLVTWVLPASLQAAVVPQSPETLSVGAAENGEGGLGEGAAEAVESLLKRGARCLVLGPGLGRAPGTVALVQRLLGSPPPVPVVLDADALYALAHWEEAVALRRSSGEPPWILTPHPGEMARLAGKSTEDIVAHPLTYARTVAERYRAIVVLKGARTVIACWDGRAWINTTGNPALAAGGTGDVLAGAVGALLAQGCSPLEAALAGVYMHGRAGDLAMAEWGNAGVLAREVADRLPLVRKAMLETAGTCGGDGSGASR